MCANVSEVPAVTTSPPPRPCLPSPLSRITLLRSAHSSILKTDEPSYAEKYAPARRTTRYDIQTE
jgi:hypothetical protein